MPGFRLSVDTAALEATQVLLGEGFRRADTSHFVVLSDCDTAWTNTRAQVLERTRDQYFRVAKRMGVLVVPHERKLLCVFFKDHEMYRAFARTHDRVEAAWVAGYYSTAANRIVFFNEASAPGYEDAGAQLDTYRARVRSLREQADAARANGQAVLAERFGTQADDLEERIRSAGKEAQRSCRRGIDAEDRARVHPPAVIQHRDAGPRSRLSRCG
jgi:hypothetical protein